jgi:hypothetical protein
VAELDQAAQQLVSASARISPHEVESQAGQSSATSGTPLAGDAGQVLMAFGKRQNDDPVIIRAR